MSYPRLHTGEVRAEPWTICDRATRVSNFRFPLPASRPPCRRGAGSRAGMLRRAWQPSLVPLMRADLQRFSCSCCPLISWLSGGASCPPRGRRHRGPRPSLSVTFTLPKPRPVVHLGSRLQHAAVPCLVALMALMLASPPNTRFYPCQGAARRDLLSNKLVSSRLL